MFPVYSKVPKVWKRSFKFIESLLKVRIVNILLVSLLLTIKNFLFFLGMLTFPYKFTDHNTPVSGNFCFVSFQKTAYP